MTVDPIQDFFAEEPKKEFYPGSTRVRREQPKEANPTEDWRDDFFLKNIGGRERKMYTVGSLANALGISVNTLKDWIKYERIPEAPFRLASNMIVKGQTVAGRRLYTEEYIDSLVEIFQRHGLWNTGKRVQWERHPELTTEIHTRWVAINRESKRSNI